MPGRKPTPKPKSVTPKSANSTELIGILKGLIKINGDIMSGGRPLERPLLTFNACVYGAFYKTRLQFSVGVFSA